MAGRLTYLQRTLAVMIGVLYTIAPIDIIFSFEILFKQKEEKAAEHFENLL